MLDDPFDRLLADYAAEDAFNRSPRGEEVQPRRPARPVGPCPCECSSGGFCGGCGHAGCGGRR